MPKFQIISDIHVENNVSISEVIEPADDTILIIAGDLGRIEDEKYKITLQWLCSQFKRVILVPGNHEYYSSDPTVSYNEITNKMYMLKTKFGNLDVLMNNYIIIEGILIFGSTLWSYCPYQYYKQLPIYNGENKLIDCEEYNQLYNDARKSLELALGYAHRYEFDVIVITHYAPTFKGTFDQKYNNDIKNFMYASSCEAILDNDIIKWWIYGHTGFNGDQSKLVTNQVNKDGYKKNKMISL